MLESVVGRLDVTSGWPYMASKGLISRGCQGRARVQRGAKGDSLTQSS
jgi:hypothetical protein